MLTGNLAHQLVLAVTTAITFGIAPHKNPCPLAHRAVVMNHEENGSVIEARAAVGRHGLRATISLNW
jgi:hypothetical protein